MTERGGAMICCWILAPPLPDATILNYLNDKEGGAIIFCRILAPPSPDATILNYLNDRERGHHNLVLGFSAPPPPRCHYT